MFQHHALSSYALICAFLTNQRAQAKVADIAMAKKSATNAHSQMQAKEKKIEELQKKASQQKRTTTNTQTSSINTKQRQTNNNYMNA